MGNNSIIKPRTKPRTVRHTARDQIFQALSPFFYMGRSLGTRLVSGWSKQTSKHTHACAQYSHTIFYIYCTGNTEYSSYTPGSHSACAVRNLLQVNFITLRMYIAFRLRHGFSPDEENVPYDIKVKVNIQSHIPTSFYTTVGTLA